MLSENKLTFVISVFQHTIPCLSTGISSSVLHTSFQLSSSICCDSKPSCDVGGVPFSLNHSQQTFIVQNIITSLIYNFRPSICVFRFKFTTADQFIIVYHAQKDWEKSQALEKKIIHALVTSWLKCL